MKKLLLLLLLPSIVLAQDPESIRPENFRQKKLFFELKQAVGLPSIGIKLKTKNENYWNVGVNIFDLNLAIPKNERTVHVTEVGPYISYSHFTSYKISIDFGLSSMLYYEESIGFLFYTGLFYGNTTTFGFHLGVAHTQNFLIDWVDGQPIYKQNNFNMVISPCIKFVL